MDDGLLAIRIQSISDNNGGPRNTINSAGNTQNVSGN